LLLFFTSVVVVAVVDADVEDDVDDVVDADVDDDLTICGSIPVALSHAPCACS